MKKRNLRNNSFLPSDLILADCDLMQVRLFHLSVDKQILSKHLSCVVKYQVCRPAYPIDHLTAVGSSLAQGACLTNQVLLVGEEVGSGVVF